MSIQKVAALSDKEQVDSFYLVREKNLAVGKNGRSFLTLQLADSSGAIDSKAWDNVEQTAVDAEVGQVVKIKGQVQVYQGRKQLIIHKLEKIDQAQIDISNFVAHSTQDPKVMFAKLLEIVRTLGNDSIRQLIISCLEDPELKPMLMQAPAAKTIHHAWVGGLLEHTLSIAQLMDFIGRHYSFLNRDLLIFGAIFHDIGKVWELSWEHGIAYTNRGRLVGHMEMACELIDRKSQKILGFDPSLTDILKHIVLSHHGRLEYGSPKTPQFLEAMVVAMIDDFDSKISTVKTLIDNDRNAAARTDIAWSRYSELFDRYFMTTDLKEKFK
jgi:3'-5' exoribonuclease